MFTRKILSDLALWSDSSSRKPLVLRGARQVGKTVAVELFARQFDTFASVNLDLPDEAAVFRSRMPVEDIFQAICLRQRIRRPDAPGERVLLFLDEIQSCPEAVESLRYFHEKLPHVHVIAAGSLLEIALHEEHISFPVGRVEHLFMYPLSFSEFLIAIGAEDVAGAVETVPLPGYAHDTVIQYFHRYAMIGGMPEVVARYAETQDVTALGGVYDSLLTSYEDDIAKYARTPARATVLRHCLEAAPFQAGHRIKFAGFGNSNYQSREVGEAMRTLQRAMLIHLLRPSSAVEPPIVPDMKKSPKLQYLDTGLLSHYVGLQDQVLQHEDLHALYKGLLAEHVVGQELICMEPNTRKKQCFWVRQKTQSAAEVDFLLPHAGSVIPVEVKAGKAGRLRSLHQFIDRSPCRLAVRLYAGPLELHAAETPAGVRYQLLNLPYFLTSRLREYIEWASRGVPDVST